MSFWSKSSAPLGNELLVITQKNRQDRRSNVENHLPHIKEYVTSYIRDWASTHQSFQYSINIPNIFGSIDESGQYIYSELGVSFNNAMKNVHPLCPDKDEISFIGNELQTYFKTQNLNVEYNENEFTLTINWETLPEVSSE